MLGLRSGAAGSAPAHHGIDLSAIGDRDALRQAMNPARAARAAAAASGQDATTWTPPVLRTIAAKGEGIDLVVDALDRHFRYLVDSGELRLRRRQRLRERVMEVVEQQIRHRLWHDAETMAWLETQLPLLETGAEAPYAIADALRARSGSQLTGAEHTPLTDLLPGKN
jgi:LAO/AO transport system kinase